MCGIAGIFDFSKGRQIDRNTLRMMINIIRHRGPDGTGIKVFKNVGLAHARLSIIDLETGNQPIHNETQSIWTVFNGEIFNYLELREELIKKGHRFSTKSDTEVIVHLYEEFGDEFVNHLNGQFAICLFDLNLNKMLLIRDRVGIAPLYYTKADSILYFASEIKSLLMATGTTPSVNHNALDQIFTFWSPVSPETIFNNIFEVSPGEMLIIENGKPRSKKYWDWKFPENNNYSQNTEDLLAEQLKEHMIQATRIRLRSDVPVGAYLSGGLDSSTIVSLINNYTDNKLRTFSIGFEDKHFDETDYQNELINQLNTEHSYFKCSNSDIVEMFIDTIWHTESPILRTAPVPMRILSKLVKENNYKVVLTGEGADEVLGGYDIFKEAKIRHFWSTNPSSTTRPLLLKRLYPYLDMSQGNAYLNAFFGQGIEDPDNFSFTHLTRWSSTSKCKEFFSTDLLHQVTNNCFDTMAQSLPDSFYNWHYFSRAQYLEAKSLMGGYLLCSQGDRMLMSNAVEGRFPFLDHELIEFANQIHPKYKMKGLNEKYLLKKSMCEVLPPKILERHKQPYRAPDIVAFYNNDKTSDYVNTFLGRKKLVEYGYFESDKVERLIKKIQLGRTIGYKDNMSLIGILSTQIWHYLFIEKYTDNFPKKV
jgi:asparagine synthase (glutamine-hydrolysing)